MRARWFGLVGLLLLLLLVLATVWRANRDGARPVDEPTPEPGPESVDGAPPSVPGPETPESAHAAESARSSVSTLWGFVREGASMVPAPGARVRAYDYLSRKVFTTTAASDGRFEIVEARERTTSLYVVAEKPGFARAVAERVSPSRTPLLLDLTAGGTISGRVVAAPDGKPVPAYLIRAVRVLLGGGEPFDFHRVLTHQAVPDDLVAEGSLEVEDPEGRFAISGLPPGKYDLLVFAPGHPPTAESGGGAWYDRSRGIEVAPASEVAGVTVTLARLGLVRFRVKDAETGGPVTGVWFFAGGQLDRRSYRRQVSTVSASADGVYELKVGVDGEGRYGSCRILLAKEGYGPVGWSFSGHRDETLFEVLMGRAARIRGKVLGADGDPVAGAPVFVERDDDGEMLESLETDEAGGFETGPLAAGEELTVHVFDPALENVFAVIPLNLDYGEVRELEVGGGGTAAIFGTVGIGGPSPARCEVCVDSEADRRTMVSTGPDGVFRVEGLTPGGYEVWASLVDGAGHPVEVTRKIRLAAGERVRVDLELDFLIRGTAWVSDGAKTTLAPVGFEVKARRAEDGKDADVHGTEVVGEAGRFRLRVEKLGAYELYAPRHVSLSGARIDLRKAAPRDSDLVVRPDPEDGTIVLLPVDADTGSPIPEGEYEFEHGWTSGMGWFEEGRIEFNGCGLGLHRIAVQADGYADAPLEVEITAGKKHVERTIRVSRSNAVLVEFTDPDSRAARAGLRVDDRIIVYAGVRVLDMADLIREVANTSPAARVKLTIIRNGERMELEVPGGRLGVYIANARVEER